MPFLLLMSNGKFPHNTEEVPQFPRSSWQAMKCWSSTRPNTNNEYTFHEAYNVSNLLSISHSLFNLILEPTLNKRDYHLHLLGRKMTLREV